MKKRIIGILLIVVLAVTMLSGCLGVNTERDMKQTVATVNYKGKTAVVTKLQVLEQYSQYVETYVQYYGMTEREVFDYFVDQLAVRKLLVLDASTREELPYEWDNAKMQIVPDSLSIEQRNEAQDSVNEDLESIFEEYLKTVKEEYEGELSGSSGSESGSATEEEEDTRTVRPLPEKDDDEKVYSNTELIPSWMQTKKGNYENKYERIAFRRLETLLSGQFKSEETLLQSAYESIVIRALQEKLYESINITDAQVLERFRFEEAKNIEKFTADKNAYGTAIKNNQVVYYHPETGYGTVKHILISFEEASLEGRKAENKHVYFADESTYSKKEYDDRKSSNNYSEDALKAYREALIQNLKINDYGDFADWWPTYNEETMADLVDWRDLKFDANNILALDVMTFANKVKTAVEGSANDTLEKKISKFVDYIFGYNNASESGMFNNENDYVIKPDDNTYMEEFQDMCEWLITGVAPTDFTDGGLISSEAGKVGSMGICVTDYGAHIIMVTNIFSSQTIQDGANKGRYNVTTADDLKNIIIDYEDSSNLYEHIYDTLKGAEETNVMNNYQANFIDIYGEQSIKVNEGVINAIFG